MTYDDKVMSFSFFNVSFLIFLNLCRHRLFHILILYLLTDLQGPKREEVDLTPGTLKSQFTKLLDTIQGEVTRVQSRRSVKNDDGWEYWIGLMDDTEQSRPHQKVNVSYFEI